MKPAFLFLLALVVVLAGAVAAQDSHSIEFRVDPPEAIVADQFGDLGPVSGPVLLRARSSYGAGSIELTFRAPGYQQHLCSETAAQLYARTVYPPDGVLSLRPAGLPAALHYYRWTLLTGGLPLALGLMALGVSRSRLRRSKELEERLHRPAESRKDLRGSIQGYLLGERLGGGGMASVYLAMRPEPGSEPVAIKVLSQTTSTNQEFLARFRREVGICMQLSHPNIVRLYDWGEQEGIIYLVLELVRGGTMRSRVRPEGMPCGLARHYLEPVFRAVEYAHGKGIVHRDLKPENVLMTLDEVPKLGDFGLGKSQDSESLTRTDAAMGTPAYMAPEQVRGSRFEPATDQYALGIMTFELLCGRRPFEAADPLQLVFKHVNDPPTPLRQLRPDLSAALEEVLLKMLAKQPQDRFESVAQALEALIGCLGPVEHP